MGPCWHAYFYVFCLHNLAPAALQGAPKAFFFALSTAPFGPAVSLTASCQIIGLPNWALAGFLSTSGKFCNQPTVLCPMPKWAHQSRRLSAEMYLVIQASSEVSSAGSGSVARRPCCLCSTWSKCSETNS